MKKNTIIIVVIVVAIAALIGGATIAYRHLGPNAPVPDLIHSPTIIQPETGDDATIIDDSETTATSVPTFEKTPAIDFTVYDNDGMEVSLSDMRGKPVVVNFWATWCPPCKSELPHFNALYQEMGSKVEFMMVDLTDGEGETPTNTRRFLAENGYTFPVYYDDDRSAVFNYGISSIPLTLFIDADGNIVNQNLGMMDEATLRAYLAELTQ